MLGAAVRQQRVGRPFPRLGTGRAARDIGPAGPEAVLFDSLQQLLSIV
ncbi:hypothetical protein Pmi06nite_73320 [Planotetraspora mira]|uniref:Uncharacterized protein n=1 Tax=Planotetraspora mira TaxID=58121 RepID=A0A8J3XAD4_9ACTN|nr:hypothetical protein Pmi06nite_73320 [Planotetraspora mira]